MLNENYRKFVGGLLNGTTNIDLVPYIQYDTRYVSFSADAWRNLANPNTDLGTINATNGISIVLGSGDKEAVDTDIQLESVIDNMSYVTASMTQGTKDYTKLVSVTYKNNTSDTVTVREIGLMIQEITGYGYYRRALIGRIVLDAPVVMNPEDTYAFIYGIE